MAWNRKPDRKLKILTAEGIYLLTSTYVNVVYVCMLYICDTVLRILLVF